MGTIDCSNQHSSCSRVTIKLASAIDTSDWDYVINFSLIFKGTILFTISA